MDGWRNFHPYRIKHFDKHGNAKKVQLLVENYYLLLCKPMLTFSFIQEIFLIAYNPKQDKLSTFTHSSGVRQTINT